ncbi:phosphate uptake regulator PhoU [Natronoarchaeum rubrum]|uniref:phosphate uptake regulator PhoU n=1 Tax=Natronoarchaeum rubrum TaxID=755311 RepID=UPI0021135A0B|nr:phosphate uptake regulator PhoU [Natronoarchaeum rubrum]HMB51620.1 PhoU domain-containing protein [Natronoarchaeum rubrum]
MTTNGTDEPIRRKVQLTGGSTYTISLPKEWATENGIETGTPLFLYASDDRLVAARETDDDGRTVEIEAAEFGPDALADTVLTAYVAGYDEIVLTSPIEFDAERRRAVRAAVTRLVGIEIHSQTPTRITIRSLLDGAEVSLRQTVVQMRLTALTMHEDAIDAVREHDAELARRVADQDDEVDRLFGLVSRQFHRGLSDVREAVTFDVDRTEAFAYYRIARQLERVADHAEKIAGVARRQSAAPPAELGDELDELGERSREIVRTAMDEQLEEPSLSGLQAVAERRDAVVEDVRAIDRRLYDGEIADAHLLATVLDSVERTAEYGANVAEMGLQSALRTPDGDEDDALSN